MSQYLRDRFSELVIALTIAVIFVLLILSTGCAGTYQIGRVGVTTDAAKPEAAKMTATYEFSTRR